MTALGNKLINFDERNLLQREQWLIQAHQQRMVKRNAENRMHFNGIRSMSTKFCALYAIERNMKFSFKSSVDYKIIFFEKCKNFPK